MLKQDIFLLHSSIYDAVIPMYLTSHLAKRQAFDFHHVILLIAKYGQETINEHIRLQPISL